MGPFSDHCSRHEIESRGGFREAISEELPISQWKDGFREVHLFAPKVDRRSSQKQY